MGPHYWGAGRRSEAASTLSACLFVRCESQIGQSLSFLCFCHFSAPSGMGNLSDWTPFPAIPGSRLTMTPKYTLEVLGKLQEARTEMPETYQLWFWH